MKFWNLVWILLLLFCSQWTKSADVSLTLSIPPRRRDCFHEAMTQGVEYEVEYQVDSACSMIGYIETPHRATAPHRDYLNPFISPVGSDSSRARVNKFLCGSL